MSIEEILQKMININLEQAEVINDLISRVSNLEKELHRLINEKK